jgi:hypothetical protein
MHFTVAQCLESFALKAISLPEAAIVANPGHLHMHGSMVNICRRSSLKLLSTHAGVNAAQLNAHLCGQNLRFTEDAVILPDIASTTGIASVIPAHLAAHASLFTADPETISALLGIP